ncbi:S-layer homology domain-containing protein [Paenibacillus sp. MWE-103]|uniref:S-layer homology domain-containing protein n=1 Tax=Paenibacillus artemisiicola TaxID=1172618 RepID=A0ABS3WD28_9BACL|nr:S-layer homology domain-containing protein [Paenibacillus artemisiicola]MBO7746189.1 S-layer homology domain-containing protein [Paenibacillus artemisiicola]
MARKSITWLSTICLAFALLLPQAAMAAAEPPSLSVTADKSAVDSGDDVTITVTGNDLQDVYAFELHVYYNPELLTFKTGSEQTAAVGFGTPAKVVRDGPGEAHLVFAHTKSGDSPGDGGSLELAAFTFTAAANGTAAIDVRDVKLVDSALTASGIAGPAGTSVRIGPSGGGGTGGGGTGGGSPGTPAVTDGVLAVTADQLKDNADGLVSIALPATATVVKLPGDADKLLGQASLRVVAADKAALDIPAAVLTQLKAGLTASQLQGGSIALTLKPAASDPAKLGKDARAAGPAYELKLQWIAADGSAIYDLREFAAPVTLRLPVAPSADPQLTSVFYLPDGAAPEFVGGTYTDGFYAAQVTHFSAYALLAVDKTFADVPASHWASGVIKALYAKGIVTGTSDTIFEPGRSVTRAEFTALLARALGLRAEGAPSFADVPAGAWYAGDVAAAVKAGIANGVSAASFAPNAAITRQEMATLAMRGYEARSGKPAASPAAPFKDEASIAAWARGYVDEAAALGIVKGRAAGEFAPLGASTRAEAAQVIYGVLHTP